jgi:excisionase family DNA binding protein
MSTTATPEKLMTAEEIADWLGLTVNYVYVQAKLGLIPSLQIGRHRRFRRSAVEGWLDGLA